MIFDDLSTSKYFIGITPCFDEILVGSPARVYVEVQSSAHGRIIRVI